MGEVFTSQDGNVELLLQAVDTRPVASATLVLNGKEITQIKGSGTKGFHNTY